MSMGPGGGLFGGGGFFGQGTRQYGQQFGPRGPFGPWMGCGCGSIFILLGIVLLACGGCLSMFTQNYGY